MPPPVFLLVIAALVAVALAYGYRTLTALSVLRALPEASDEPPCSPAEGETVALTGELVVEDPAPMGTASLEETDRAVGAYLWRARFPDNTNSSLTIEEWGWERQRWHTFASGLEWGRFGVVSDGQTVRIDPTWLHTATGAKPLNELEVGGLMKPDRFSISLWDSWYTYLRNRTEYRSLKWFAGYVQRHNDRIDLDRHLLETRPLVDGTSVSVSGELETKQGELVLRGSDEVPLLLTDGGFDEYSNWLRQQSLKKAGIAVTLVFLAGCLWVEWYIPLVMLLGALVISLGYRFTQDAHIIVDFFRRIFRS